MLPMTSRFRPRGQSDRPVAGNTGLDPAPRLPRVASGSKVSICLTCHGKVDWIDDRERGTWVPLDHGTRNPHRCKVTP